jgi:hypothetical protein
MRSSWERKVGRCTTELNLKHWLTSSCKHPDPGKRKMKNCLEMFHVYLNLESLDSRVLVYTFLAMAIPTPRNIGYSLLTSHRLTLGSISLQLSPGPYRCSR